MYKLAGVLALIIAAEAFGQEIHLKTRTIRPASPAAGSLPLESRPGMHRIVQFDHSPGAEDLAGLLADGNVVVSALPDNAVVVAAQNGSVTAGAGVHWVGAMDRLDKISPEFRNPRRFRRAGPARDETVTFIVEFHPDVPREVQDAVAAAEGMTLLRPPVLLANHAIVTASPRDLSALAAHDEVAYVFPADPALARDTDFNACAGMLTVAGPIAQYANIVHGWDLDSGNTAHLGYVFGSLTQKLQTSVVQSEILRALNEWSSRTNVIFHQGTDRFAPRTVFIEFAGRAHGDPFPFDGPGGILAHTFYPVPINPESIAGDMHLDAEENWHAGGDIDIYTVALHEAGHAIGLGHSDKPGDVMYPYYRRNMPLSVNDIGAAQALYGVPAGATQTGAPVTRPPTGSSTPQPLPLHLTINPGASTQANQTSMTGTVSGGTWPVSIQWQTDQGYSGRASITSAGSASPAVWTASAIPLVADSNTVTVTAFDAVREAASQTAVITSSPAATSGPSAPVAVAITSPASVVLTVSAATISLAGTASGGAGVTRVTWQTSGGATGTATGVGRWVASGIPLLTGTNTIIVRAYDAKGTNSWASLVAVRH
jgi:Matrixin